MATLRSIASEFFRAPRHGNTVWIPIGFGLVLITLSIIGSLVDNAQGMLFSVDPKFILLGFAFVLMGGAELLPVGRYRLAALLRFITVGVFIVWFLALLLSL